jgi:hypothetical protein
LWNIRNAYKVLVLKLNCDKPLERFNNAWGYDIKMDLKEMCCEDLNWNQVVQDNVQWRELVNRATGLCIP